MYRAMLRAKIHGATVTGANLNYVGSITIDTDLLHAVDILPGEQVHVVNNNNGARLETYVIAGEPGSGEVCLNGAAARLVQPGDKVIIMSYAWVAESEARGLRPRIAILDEKNRIIRRLDEELPNTPASAYL